MVSAPGAVAAAACLLHAVCCKLPGCLCVQCSTAAMLPEAPAEPQHLPLPGQSKAANILFVKELNRRWAAACGTPCNICRLRDTMHAVAKTPCHVQHSICDPTAGRSCTNTAFALPRLAGTQVEAFAVHPGGIQTGLQRHLTGIVGLLAHLLLAALAWLSWLPFVARLKSIPQVGFQTSQLPVESCAGPAHHCTQAVAAAPDTSI